MRLICFFLLLIAIGLAPGLGLSSASEWKPMAGTYALTADNYLDPSELGQPNSHLRLQLSGSAARDLFNAMKVLETKDQCTAAMLKQVGEMRCLRFSKPQRYECHFSINIARQTVEYGVAC